MIDHVVFIMDPKELAANFIKARKSFRIYLMYLGSNPAQKISFKKYGKGRIGSILRQIGSPVRNYSYLVIA